MKVFADGVEYYHFGPTLSTDPITIMDALSSDWPYPSRAGQEVTLMQTFDRCNKVSPTTDPTTVIKSANSYM